MALFRCKKKKEPQLTYYGTATNLSVARSYLTATTVSNYALFGGGESDEERYDNVVDAYNTSLTRSTPTALSAGRTNLAATAIGDYALFGGGDSYSSSNKVDAYNTSLTRSTPTALSASRGGLAATTVGNYALFGGGIWSDVVDVYTLA